MRRTFPFCRAVGVLTLAGWLAAGALRADETEGAEIRWAIVDGPPYHNDGPKGVARSVDELGDGLTDRLIAGIAAQLPQWRHVLVPTGRSRMWREIQAGRPLCYADAFKTPERLRWAYFTLATAPVPQMLAAREGLLPAGEVSLQALLKQTDLTAVFERDRSYGPVLDPMIRSAGSQVRIGSLPSTPQLLRMLEAGRMDYLVEYPLALHYLAQRLQPAPRISYHALAEERQPLPSYIACTRSPWGRKAIEALDQAMRRWAAQPAAAATLLRSLPAEVARTDGARIEAFYRERAQRSVIE
ncbi:uncharacterized protein (TIGR02285 family) [Inhella inkyongensis]|uniref:Uncharacterized protein (TIGR02285 family) n=1 Tax=Inhella inkyongensis TaxID=392593 RepID=A0A840SCT8_9BURK|nr:hypothetical protein [Inhella inkyongensis]MBB5206129.1 uncharacterized protein (TIGR02285 family) [Inhella inkyongensis]